jgi:hypothetical protein
MKPFIIALKKLNFYFVSGILLAIWLVIFDSNNIISQLQMQLTIYRLQNEKSYYTEQLKQSEKNQALVLGSSKQIEQLAREKYLMKKNNEVLYVISE